MASQTLRFKRGTTAQVAAYTGGPGEPIYNAETRALHLQDGVTPGGKRVLVSTDPADGMTVGGRPLSGVINGSGNRTTLTPDAVRVIAPGLVTSQVTPGGSLGEGASDVQVTRTGGFGQYGCRLNRYDVEAATPAGQFDVAETAWITHRNLTGGQAFGAWFGANTPSTGNDYSGVPLNQIYTGGAAVGAEINVGNRWSDFGLQIDFTAQRYTTGLQVVPDVLPAKDGPTTAVYPGTFGIALAPSIHGHRWWTGFFTRYDTIMPGGYSALLSGGSTSNSAPLAMVKAQGYFTQGIDFSAAAYSGSTIKFADGQSMSVAGGGTVNLVGNFTYDGAAWTNYTPTVSAASGTITTVGSVQAAYVPIGKTVTVRVSAIITTNGTAAGSLSITLPDGLPAAGGGNATFVEDLVTGKMAAGLIYPNATAVTAIRLFDGAYPGGDGRRLIGTFTYQIN